jgi:hypothetical protein
VGTLESTTFMKKIKSKEEKRKKEFSMLACMCFFYEKKIQ